MLETSFQVFEGLNQHFQTVVVPLQVCSKVVSTTAGKRNTFGLVRFQCWLGPNYYLVVRPFPTLALNFLHVEFHWSVKAYQIVKCESLTMFSEEIINSCHCHCSWSRDWGEWRRIETASHSRQAAFQWGIWSLSDYSSLRHRDRRSDEIAAHSGEGNRSGTADDV